VLAERIGGLGKLFADALGWAARVAGWCRSAGRRGCLRAARHEFFICRCTIYLGVVRVANHVAAHDAATLGIA